MTIKKIVKNPTPESSSFLYYGDDNKIIESLIYNKNNNSLIIDFLGSTLEQYKYNQSFFPVSFNDIKTIKNLNNKYGSKRPNLSWKGKILHFIGSNEIIEILLLFLIQIIIALSEIFIAMIAIGYTIHYFNNDILSTIVLIIGTILCTFIVVISCFLAMEKFHNIVDNPYQRKYLKLVNKKEKKLLKNKIFLHIPTYKERKNHEKIIEKTDIIFNKNTDSIDLYELKNLYNEYMRLLSFMLTNKDNISQELYDNYDKQLEELSHNIIKESNNIITIIDDKNDYIKKNKEELDIINQEIVDNDAMTIFPMK